MCYLVACMMRTRKQNEFDVGRPLLRIASWSWSPSWPDQRHLRGLAVQPGSLIGLAFLTQDFQAGHGQAGISYRDGVFDIEAAGYTFLARGKARSQVAVLLRALKGRPRWRHQRWPIKKDAVGTDPGSGTDNAALSVPRGLVNPIPKPPRAEAD